MTTQQLCDTERALRAVGGDRALLCRMIELFVKQSPNLIAQIEDAVARQDGVALWRAGTRFVDQCAILALMVPAAPRSALNTWAETRTGLQSRLQLSICEKGSPR